MRAALVQITSGDDPAANLDTVRGHMRAAAGQGAEFVLTPEVTNCLSASRSHQASVLQLEEDDPTLAGLRAEARALGLWLLIGSLALKTGDPDGRFANRSFLVGPDGEIRARYDKIHMFDVEVTPEETYRESAGYRPGEQAVVTEVAGTPLGLSICYDIRFSHLYRALARAGARILTVPAAFSPVTGAAHWEVLLRARAIETGCFVLAPAQTGTHPASTGKQRSTHGHSMAIAPWGEVLLDAGTEPGVYMVDLDLAAVDAARGKLPSLANARDFSGPA
ncbi:carbon-nitrogen hydrolase family protein [Marinibacterium profundimaris]|uniref:Amidohydrolase n=1 Tax=Marinibacterium profundimaris TaxID=1679460 RepID=A0A225NVD1_9RHOB|nr:carbon-nitrogen hydrolase family protein [Marinibacterium profundimaris]OWU75756.1 amidohydrolase [Marinibacterium profundimaris]